MFAPFTEFNWETRGECKRTFGVDYLRLMHERASTIQELFKSKGWDFERYIKITTIRNPWERVVSIYNYLQKSNSVYAKSFEDFVKRGLKSFMDANNCYTTYELVHDKNGKMVVDHIIKLEDLETELKAVVKKHFPFELDYSYHLNVCNHSAYQNYYTPETRKLVAEMFAFDIKIGGYQFEELKYDLVKILDEFKREFNNNGMYMGVDIECIAKMWEHSFNPCSSV